MQHFIDINRFNSDELYTILDNAKKLKNSGDFPQLLRGKTVAMIFEKPSTRTRFSFERAITDLGGNAIVVSSQDMQLGRGETITDTARVLSRYVHAIMLRTISHDKLLDLAKNATIPIINGLSDYSHPCQIMADLLTIIEHCDRLENKKIVWIGDPNNVFNSWLQAAVAMGLDLTLSCPVELYTDELRTIFTDNPKLHWERNPQIAAKNADVVMTDTFISMGCVNPDAQIKLLTPYQVNDTIMNIASNNAIFMHCLPAVRGQEVTDSVIDSPQSHILQQAENRMHVQRAILKWCLA